MILEVSVSQFLVAVMVICVIWLIMRARKSTKLLPPGTRFPPCLPAVPVLGSLPFLPTKLVDLPRHFMEQAKKHGGVFGVYMGSKYSVILNDVESIREALLKRSAHFSDRGQSIMRDSINIKGKGLAFINYSDAFRRKRQLCLSILKQFGYASRFTETRISAGVEEMVQQIRLMRGKACDPHDVIRMCFVNVITSMMFGRRYSYGHPTLQEIWQFVLDFSLNIPQAAEMFPLLRFVPPISGQIKTMKALISNSRIFLDREINAALEEAVNNQADSFVRQFVEMTATDLNKSSLIDATFDREELFQIIRELFIGGVETTTTTIRWILLHLANDRNVQSRLQKEVDDVVGRDRMCSLDDEVNMPYTQAFILEILRRRGVGPLAIFHATSCDTQLADYFIPAETMVIVNLYSVLMDPAKWNEPEVFRPERFLDEHGQITGKERVIAFSIGKRDCPGELVARQTLFLFLTGIIQNFDVRPPDGQCEVTCGELLTLAWRPTEFQVRIIERQR